MITLFLTLALLAQFKHFIADFPLQGSYMLGKFKDKGWVLPLAAHCGVHFVFTFIIAATVLGWNNDVGLFVLGVSLFDFTVHFIMDRVKASPKMLGRYESLSKEQFKGLMEARQLAQSAHDHFQYQIGKEDIELESAKEIVRIDSRFKSNKYFWLSLGFDQLIHGLTDVIVVYMIVVKAGG